MKVQTIEGALFFQIYTLASKQNKANTNFSDFLLLYRISLKDTHFSRKELLCMFMKQTGLSGRLKLIELINIKGEFIRGIYEIGLHNIV